MDLSKLEKIIGYTFTDRKLLKEALTHSSYFHENPKSARSHNERFEFLGDAVLELAVTEELFNRYPNYEEGTLTSLRAALVNYQMMARVAGEIELGDFLFLSRGEAKDKKSRAREVILANAMEALIGAIHLDKDYKAAKKFIIKFILVHLNDVIKNGDYRDAKSTYQEKTQSIFRITPTYKVLEESGPDHAKIFKVGVYLKSERVAEGEGQSKQDAELEAAKNALEVLEKE
jgi:ribonuclease III